MSIKTKAEDARERILRATLTCIERDGIDATGIREIAREAQVNSAAINYYFQSKDKLISLALTQTLEQAFGHVLIDFDRLRSEGLGAREAFEVTLEDLVSNSTRYPRIAHAHFREALVHQRYEGLAVQRLNAFLSQLEPKVAPEAQLKGERLRIALTQVWSALFLVAMLPRLFDGFVSLDFGSIEVRRTWVKQAARLIFGNAS